MLSKASLKSNIITVGIFFIISRLREVTRKYHTTSLYCVVFEGQFVLKGKVTTHCKCTILSITLDKVGNSSDRKVDYWLPSDVPSL